MQAGVRCPGSPEAAISRDPAPRLKAIDALRGLVIVLMALDHARDFFHAGAMTFSPTDLARTTPLLFATRWVTHLCAPLFSLLAGVGAWLRLQRPGETRASLSRYLVSRGLWLIVLELVVMRVAMNFSLSMAYPPLLLVLWVLGLSMLILAALVWLPLSVVLAGSLVVIVGHNLLDPIRAADLGQFAGVWRVLHEPGVLPVGGIVAVVGYPLVPWCAVMAAGYGLGPLFGALADVRQRRLVTMGIACCVAFLGLRLMNGYGDPAPWSVQPSAVLTVLSFLNTTKYPPSLAFLLMTLGPGLLLLAWMDRRAWPAGQPLVVFGRVPLFFFVSHFFVLHGLAAVAALATYGRAAAAFLWMPLPSMGGPAAAFPPGFGYPLCVRRVVGRAGAVVAGLPPTGRQATGANVDEREWQGRYACARRRIESREVSDCSCSASSAPMCCSRNGGMTSSMAASVSSPFGVIVVLTYRRSSPPRVRAMRPVSSRRSSRRVTSGTRRTIRCPTSLRQSPCSPAPRRIRSTLYWVAVTPEGFSRVSIACSSKAAVRCRPTKASSCGDLNGRVCLSSCSRSVGMWRRDMFKHVMSTRKGGAGIQRLQSLSYSPGGRGGCPCGAAAGAPVRGGPSGFFVGGSRCPWWQV